MSIVKQLHLGEAPNVFNEVVTTADDHEIIAAVDGRSIVISDMVIQAQGESDQQVSIKAGETELYGPLIVPSMQTLTLAAIGGRVLPVGEPLVVSISEAENCLIAGGYYVS